MRYAVVIERADDNFSAYVPDLPGCITTGKTVQETLRNMKEALTGHIETLAENGEPVPDPTVLVDYLDVSIPTATA